MTITVQATPAAQSVDAQGYLLTGLSNISASGVAYLRSLLGIGSSGLDLSTYITPSMAINDLTASPSTWTDVSSQLRKAFSDAADQGTFVNATRLTGMYFIDPASPILIRQGSGFVGPVQPKCQLSYVSVGGVLKDKLNNPGLTFIVDTQSTSRMVPKFARQGATTITGLQVAGVRLMAQAANLDVSAYPTITGSPLDGAPIIVTDHKHDSTGAVLGSGQSAKAGNTYLEAHIVGVMQSAYVGDPLTTEEGWATATASGQQTGISFTTVKLTGCALKRVLGVARSTAGGLTVEIQNIPPWWTGISQPNSGGTTNYALLKWQQQNCRIVDMWHRAVGFDIYYNARSARYGVYMQAGYNANGPAGQDTGKYNAGTIKHACERVITALHVEPNAYLHRVTNEYGGHYMDEYNLKGENGAMIEILTDGTVAGSIDKAVYDAWVNGKDYGIDDKVSDGSGNVFSCTQAGTASVVPTASGPNYNSSTLLFTDPGAGGPVWIYRNAGFKPVGRAPFAASYHKGIVQETSGPVFLNTAADGHLVHDLTGLGFSNWCQAKTHHNDAAIQSLSSAVLIRHNNSRSNASGNSTRVYDVANYANTLRVSGNEYMGQKTVPVDGSGVPTGAMPSALSGGTIPSTFWIGKNCMAYTAGVAQGDDDGDESDG